MANQTFSILSERWLDQVVLSASVADVGADLADNFFLPAGLGDVAFIEGMARIVSVATMVANPELLGARWFVVNTAGSVVDFIGVSRWSRSTSTTALATHVSPDPLVIIRQTEGIEFSTPELDTNAAATGDVTVIIKCVRVRPMESTPAPLQLVR